MKKNHRKPTCQQVNLELMQHFDEGSLEHIPEVLHAHLQTCPNCREDFEALNSLERKFNKLSDVDPDELYWVYFLPNLRRKMAETSTIRRAKDPAWAPALAMAVFFIVLAFKSPVPVAPPSWYDVQPYVSLGWGFGSSWNGGYIEMEDESFAEKINSQEFVEYYLGEGSAELFENLSESSQNLTLDLNERLARLKKDKQDAFFEKIKNIPIIKS
jgi:hypothetical protein